MQANATMMSLTCEPRIGMNIRPQRCDVSMIGCPDPFVNRVPPPGGQFKERDSVDMKVHTSIITSHSL